MKKRILSMLIATTMLITVNIPAIAEENNVDVNVVTNFPTGNLLENSGFETGDLTGWHTDGSGVFTVVKESFQGTSESKDVVNGSYALRAAAADATSGYIYQEIEASKNTNYVLNASWFDLTTAEGSIKVYGDSVAEENLIKTAGNIFGGETWYSTTVAFNSGEYEKLIIRIDAADVSGSNYFCLDNLALRTAGNTQTIDFENGLDGFNIKSKGNFEITNEKANGGEYALKFSSGNNWVVFNTPFALDKHQYYIKFDYYIESGKLGLRIKNSHENNWSGYNSNYIAGDTLSTAGSWQTFSSSIVGEIGTNNFVELAFQNMETDTVVYIDNISCVSVNTSVDSIAVTGENKDGGVLHAEAKAFNYGYNLEDPVTYQWQISSDEKNWTDVNGATEQDYEISYTDSEKYLRVKVTTTNRYSSNFAHAYYSKSIKITEIEQPVIELPESRKLLNVGFEDGLSNWSVSSENVFGVSSDIAGNGVNVLKITHDENSPNAYISQEIRVDKNSDYYGVISAYRAADATVTSTAVAAFKIYGTEVKEANLLGSYSNLWNVGYWYDFGVAVNTGEHEKLIYVIEDLQSGTSEAVYFDNCKLLGEDIEQDLGFENSTDDATINSSVFVRSNENPYSGEYSLKYSGIDNAWPRFKTIFKCEKNTDYVLSFNFTNYAKFNIGTSLNGSDILSGQTERTENGVWRNYSIVVNSGDKGIIYLSIEAEEGAENTAYYDDIKCLKMTPETTQSAIYGMVSEGKTLHVEAEVYCDGRAMYGWAEYQWQYSADGVTYADITGATGDEYIVPAEYKDGYIRIKIIPKVNYYGTIVVGTDEYLYASKDSEAFETDTLAKIDELILAFDENDYQNIRKLAFYLALAEEYGLDITSIENYAYYQNVIGEDNMTEVKNVSFTNDNGNVSIKLELTSPVAASYITAENFRVQANREDITYTVDADVNGEGEATAAILNFEITDDTNKYYQVYAKYGYLCNYSEIFTIYNVAVEEEIVLTNSAATEIKKLTDVTDGILNAEMVISAGIEKEVVSTAAVYDETGRLYSADTRTDALAEGEEKTLSFALTLPIDGTLNDKYIFKAFIWDENNKPLTDVQYAGSLTKTYGIDVLNDESQNLTVAYLGGSQTQGGYYTTPLTNKWNADRAGGVTMINAGIGGSGTDYGAFRVYNDVISKKPDVVFIEFTLNDMYSDKTTVRKNVEGIIRQLNSAEHIPVIIFLHIPSDIDSQLSASASNYNQVLSHYGLTAIDLHSYIKGLVDAGTYTYADMFQADGVHLNTTSGNLVADYIYDSITGENKATYLKNTDKADAMFENSFKNPTLISPLAACYDATWQDAEPGDKVMEGYNTPIEQNLFDHYMVTNTEGAVMTFTFSGDKLLLEGLRGKDGRYVKYEVINEDGSVVKIGKTGNYVSGYNWYKGSYMLLQGLGAGKHTLKITVLSSDGCGEAFGIGGIWVDE